MILAATFFAELFALFLLSRVLTRLLSVFFHRITRSQTITIYLIALLFFPGTLIHELAHFFMARLLFVPVANMEFIPKLNGSTVKLGSVSIARTDPIRRLLIGMAPFFIGTSILLGVLFLATRNNLFANRIFVMLI